MKIKTSIFQKCLAVTATGSLLMLSACGDSDVAAKTEDMQQAAAAVQQASELVKSADKVSAGSGKASAAELVAEHNIHWSQRALFPADTFDGKTGLQAAYVGYSRLEKLAANKHIDRQIRDCHDSVGGLAGSGTLTLLADTYNFENAIMMDMFKAEESESIHIREHGGSVENDLGLYYIGLVKQHNTTLSKEDKRAVNETFWQWCIALPVKHFQPPYSENPISL